MKSPCDPKHTVGPAVQPYKQLTFIGSSSTPAGEICVSPSRSWRRAVDAFISTYAVRPPIIPAADVIMSIVNVSGKAIEEGAYLSVLSVLAKI